MTQLFPRPSSVSFSHVRDLLESDAASLEVTRGTSTLRRMRDSHHGLARLIAAKHPDIEASRITGFSPSYIGELKNHDPAFRELVSFYEKEIEKEHADLRVRLTTLALDVSAEIQDRIHNAPETFSNTELRQFLIAFADRVGYGPSSTVHAEVDVISRLSYDDQLRIANALEELNKPKMIDVTPEDAAA